jgi:hypothetical protein
MTQPTLHFEGTYLVHSQLDLSQVGALPDPIGAVLHSLGELHDHPGAALVDILRSQTHELDGWPDFVIALFSASLDQLFAQAVYQQAPSLDALAQLIADYALLTRNIELQDALTLSAGGTEARQLIDTVFFQLHGKRCEVALRNLTPTWMTSASVTPRSTQVADADLTLGAEQMSFPVGELLNRAAAELIFSQMGASDLGGALAKVAPCDQLTTNDPTDLIGDVAQSLCTLAIQAFADELEQKLAQQTWTVGISTAQAALFDVSASRPTPDQQADHLGQGSWTFALGPNAMVAATFEGDRVTQ